MSDAIGLSIDRGRSTPLLVLRLPEFAQLAWREGKHRARALERRTVAAFRRAARRIVRDGDVLAHDRGSDHFVVAMLQPSRGGVAPGSREIRSALERIAAAMSLQTGQQMETGWWIVETRGELEALSQTMDSALERGHRERERYAMFATVGHELRTPLTSIRGYIETLLEGDSLDAQTHRRFLETARRETLRLGRLVDGMLEFSLLDLSLLERPASCDAVEQINAAVDAILPLARQRSIAIEVHETSATAIARVDGDACMHALLNLLENAVKHGREGGVAAVTCERDDRFVRITIDDDGPGIAPSEREAIFRLGVRGRAATHSGSGIGLAIVKAIAERSGGEVSLHASQLGGARFVLCFPCLMGETI